MRFWWFPPASSLFFSLSFSSLLWAAYSLRFLSHSGKARTPARLRNLPLFLARYSSCSTSSGGAVSQVVLSSKFALGMALSLASLISLLPCRSTQDNSPLAFRKRDILMPTVLKSYRCLTTPPFNKILRGIRALKSRCCILRSRRLIASISLPESLDDSVSGMTLYLLIGKLSRLDKTILPWSHHSSGS